MSALTEQEVIELVDCECGARVGERCKYMPVAYPSQSKGRVGTPTKLVHRSRRVRANEARPNVYEVSAPFDPTVKRKGHPTAIVRSELLALGITPNPPVGQRAPRWISVYVHSDCRDGRWHTWLDHVPAQYASETPDQVDAAVIALVEKYGLVWTAIRPGRHEDILTWPEKGDR